MRRRTLPAAAAVCVVGAIGAGVVIAGSGSGSSPERGFAEQPLLGEEVWRNRVPCLGTARSRRSS